MSFILSILLFCSISHAGMFDLQTVEEQIKESEGIFQGYFLEKKFTILENDQVSTQMIFKIKKEHGLQSELYGMDEVIVHYPGEEKNGKLVASPGVPKFISGESVVLFIKVNDNRYWGQNSGFGSFKLVNYGNKSMLINSLYPKNVKVGQMDLTTFEELVREIKGSSLKVVHTDQSLALEELSQGSLESSSDPVIQGPYRSIATVTKEEEKERDQPYASNYSLVTFLALAGGLFRLMRQRKSV